MALLTLTTELKQYISNRTQQHSTPMHMVALHCSRNPLSADARHLIPAQAAGFAQQMPSALSGSSHRQHPQMLAAWNFNTTAPLAQVARVEKAPR
jgi:hypothetical protein